MPVRILIVDDHPVVREGLRAVLGLYDDLELVAEAAGITDALQAAVEHRPDVVLLDLQLDDGNGLMAISRLTALEHRPVVVVLTSFVDHDYVRQAIRLGASGYLVKNAGPDSILAGIRAAARGEMPLDPGIVRLLASSDLDPMLTLTPRELEVLALLAKGKSNRDIAEALVIGGKTVKTHVSAILTKLQVEDRTKAAIFGKDHGL